MSYRLYIPVLSALLLLASCAKEQPDTAPAPETPAASVSFTYTSYRGAVSRAAVPALNAEKIIFPGDMYLYVCSGGVFVRQLVLNTDYTETDLGDDTTIELSASFIREFAGQRVVLYFVANNDSSVGGSHIDGNTDPSIETTTGEFEDLRTTPLGDSEWYAPGTKAELIRTIDDDGIKTYGLLMTARSKEILIAGNRAPERIELRRRAARFDILNPVPTHYALNEIYVSGAKVQAPLFGTSAADHSDIATRSLEEIIGPNAGDYGSDNIAPCVFYLYPTDLETTTIAIEVADLSTQPVTTAIFRVDASELTNKKIEANTRYIIFFDEDKLEIGLRPGDYTNP